MKTFNSGPVQISYLDEGSGDPVLLIHGFASNITTNWVSTGWVDALNNAGYRVIAIDNRGHGNSEKLYDLGDYGGPIMAEVAQALLDHLEVEKSHVMGYSMGARISAFLTIRHPERVRSVVFAGLGYNMVRGVGAPGPIAVALEAESIDEVKNDTARTFRAFAESTGSDLRALATCIRSSRDKILPEDLQTIKMPVLVAVGTQDVIAGPAQGLADLIPGAKILNIQNRDHMRAVGDKTYKEGVLKFFAEHT